MSKVHDSDGTQCMTELLDSSEYFPRDVVSIHQLERPQIEHTCALAAAFEAAPRADYGSLLRHRVVACLFYQPSTRTRISFESAALRLGATCTGFADARTTRAGDFYQETLYDVVRTLSQYADCLVLRHFDDGAGRLAAAVSSVPVISAGDGSNEHPTQGIVDAWTMSKRLGGLDGATIGFLGDPGIRSIRATTICLTRFDVARIVYLPAPGTDVPADLIDVLSKRGIPWERCDDVETLLQSCDALQTIGVRHPDHRSPHQDSDALARPTPERFRIDASLLRRVGRNVPIVHPGARKDELATDVDALPEAAQFESARNGLWVKMAILATLLRGSE